MPGSGLYTFENMALTLEWDIGPQVGRLVFAVLFKRVLRLSRVLFCFCPAKKEYRWNPMSAEEWKTDPPLWFASR